MEIKKLKIEYLGIIFGRKKYFVDMSVLLQDGRLLNLTGRMEGDNI